MPLAQLLVIVSALLSATFALPVAVRPEAQLLSVRSDAGIILERETVALFERQPPPGYQQPRMALAPQNSGIPSNYRAPRMGPAVNIPQPPPYNPLTDWNIHLGNPTTQLLPSNNNNKPTWGAASSDTESSRGPVIPPLPPRRRRRAGPGSS